MVFVQKKYPSPYPSTYPIVPLEEKPYPPIEDVTSNSRLTAMESSINTSTAIFSMGSGRCLDFLNLVKNSLDDIAKHVLVLYFIFSIAS